MQLLLIRHAEASNDAPRPLTEGGRQAQRLVSDVACIGHEPHLSRFAAALVTPDGVMSLEVKKSGVIGIRCEGHPARGRGTLLFAFRPDELLRLRGDR